MRGQTGRSRVRLDAINARILEVLQLDAAMTNQELADKIHLSASACHARVKSLEAAGVIRRYITDVDVDRVTSSISAFIEIALDSHRPEDFREFDRYVAGQAQLIWSYKISGAADYLLLAMVPDMPSLRVLTDELLEAGIPVAKLTTIPVIEQTKRFAGLPLLHMLGGEGAVE